MAELTDTEMVILLKNEHEMKSQEIRQLQAAPAFDSLKMKSLKTEKAYIKRQIVAFGGKTSGMARASHRLMNHISFVDETSVVHAAPPPAIERAHSTTSTDSQEYCTAP
jgi:hypothetical protein